MTNKVDFNKISTLNHTLNNLVVDFSVLIFIPNKKHNVLYRIYTKKWNKLNNSNLLLSSLTSGNYSADLQVENILKV